MDQRTSGTQRPSATTSVATTKRRRSTGAAAAAKASHDLGIPANLVPFLTAHWGEAETRPVRPLAHLAELGERRARLALQFPDDVLVIPTGTERVRANDTHFRFRPGSDFFYLTGCPDRDAVLILWPQAVWARVSGTGSSAKGRGQKPTHVEQLFVADNPGRGQDAAFFTDRNNGEFWVGARLGVAGTKARYGIEDTQPLTALTDVLTTIARAKLSTRVLRGLDAQVDARLATKNQPDDGDLKRALAELRLLKSDHEVQAIKRACKVTKAAFEDAIRALKTGKTERAVEAAFAGRARIEGNDVGYNVIAAAGPHACVLHWNDNDGPLRSSDCILIDAGVEIDELYTGDVTRVFPLSGRFSAAQREVYALVLRAQRAAIAAVKPGAQFYAPHYAAMAELTRGLIEMKILEGPFDVAFATENQYYRRYTIHGTSHMLGIDVHDAAAARPEKYKAGHLEPGMVLTIEPGLYFQTNDLTVPKKYRGIGVRIEDDVLVTEKGRTVLSSSIPKEPDDVEAWMAEVWSR